MKTLLFDRDGKPKGCQDTLEMAKAGIAWELGFVRDESDARERFARMIEFHKKNLDYYISREQRAKAHETQVEIRWYRRALAKLGPATTVTAAAA